MVMDRVTSARIAGSVRAAKIGGKALGTLGSNGLLRKFEQQVDPHGLLDPKDRRTRAIALRRAHMLRLAQRSKQVRAALKDTAAN